MNLYNTKCVVKINTNQNISKVSFSEFWNFSKTREKKGNFCIRTNVSSFFFLSNKLMVFMTWTNARYLTKRCICTFTFDFSLCYRQKLPKAMGPCALQSNTIESKDAYVRFILMLVLLLLLFSLLFSFYSFCSTDWMPLYRNASYIACVHWPNVLFHVIF